MKSKDKENWKIRVIKSDLPELQERINFLTDNAWEISVGIDGVEKVDNSDGRLVVHKVPEEWPVQVMIQWLNNRIKIRQQVQHSLRDEIRHLEFVKDLAEKQLQNMEIKKADK